MRNKHTIRNFIAMAVIISTLLVNSISAFAAKNADGLTMKLSMIQGTVAVLDVANRPKKATENMQILSGYNIATNMASYAWINLDSSKLVKLDALSKVKVTKDKKNMTLDVSAGKVFIDMSKDFEKDESLILRTSNVIASIKGKTSAEVDVKNGNTTIVGLDGKMDCVVIDVSTGQLKQVTVLPGKKSEIQSNASKTSIVTRSATKSDISGFSKLQIAQNSLLEQRIIEASGSKIGNISGTEAVKALLKDIDKQGKELATKAKEAGTDPQSVINSMMGADISSKNLAQLAASAQNTPSSNTDDEQPHSHSYEAAGYTPATCISEGFRTYLCKCGDVKTETIPKIAHNYEEISNTPATCTLEGSRVLKCSACGHSITETLNIIEHSYNGDVETREVSDNPYNCRDYYIVESKYCTMCESYIVQSKEHEYSEHSIEEVIGGEGEISPATCVEPRIVKYKCTRVLNIDAGIFCSYYEEREIPGSQLGHEYGDKKVYVGSSDICYRYICNRCEGYGEGILHTPGVTSGLPTEDKGVQYIKCAESGCNMYAEYSWNSGKYEATGSWVSLVERK